MATIFPIEDVADVILAIGDRPIASRDFGTPLIITTGNLLTDQVTEFTALSQVSAMGFSTYSPLYKMVSNILGKTFSPRKVLVGKRSAAGYGFYVNFDVAVGSTYTVNISAYNTGTSTRYIKSFSYTSISGDDATDIATALASLVEVDTDIGPLVSATVSTGRLQISPAGLSPTSVGNATTNCYITEDAVETVSAAADLAVEARADFFYILSTDQSDAALLELGAWAEANKRGYFASTASAAVYASGSSDIVSQLKALQYNNTVVLSSPTANIDFPCAAAVGAEANILPGASDLYGKTLTGASISNFTVQQANYAKAKGANVYINRGGLGWLEMGDAVSGRAFDVTKGSLWLEASLEEDLFGLIKRESDLGRKIPFTDLGIAMVDSVMRRRLEGAVKNGFLASFKTFPPLAENVSTNDKANRLLPDVQFEGVLAGGIRKVVIRGYLVL